MKSINLPLFLGLFYDMYIHWSRYRSYSAKDVAEFFGEYCKSNAGRMQHDYGKPGLPDDVLGKIWTTTMSNLWVKQAPVKEGGNCSFIAQTAFEPAASEEYGAAAGWTIVGVGGTADMGGPADMLQIEVGMFNKSTTRIPEAMFMQFQPTGNTGAGKGKWFADKLGEWVGEDEIVPGGSQHLQGGEYSRPTLGQSNPCHNLIGQGWALNRLRL